MTAAIEIDSVAQVPPATEYFFDHRLESPRKGGIDRFAAVISGWVLARSPVIGVEVTQDGEVLQRTPVNVNRPDVALAYPDVRENTNSGFRIPLNLLTIEPELNLQVEVVLQGNVRLPLGTIRGRRRKLNSGFAPQLQPIMLTTLGRTGSTWVTRLLSQHSGIVAYRPFEFEPRVASYWIAVLQALSEPASYLQAMGTLETGPTWWLGSQGGKVNLDLPAEEPVRLWVGGRSLECLAGFCQSQLERFYQHAAEARNQPEARYFIEKYLPNSTLPVMWLLYPEARQIVLVRDPRDMVCSIFAFNAKRGFNTFGRDRAANDEEYIMRLQGSWHSLVKAWRKRERDSYLLRYEDFILRPEETLRSLLNYLGLQSDSDTIQRMIQTAEAQTPDFQAYHRTTSDPKQSIGRWRSDLAPHLQDVCEEAFGFVLDAFGYASKNE